VAAQEVWFQRHQAGAGPSAFKCLPVDFSCMFAKAAIPAENVVLPERLRCYRPEFSQRRSVDAIKFIRDQLDRSFMSHGSCLFADLHCPDELRRWPFPYCNNSCEPRLFLAESTIPAAAEKPRRLRG
jgi:hypothetical protein